MNSFYRRSRTTSIIIPSSVTKIENDVFSFCGMLSRLYIPDSVTEFGDYMFTALEGTITIYCFAQSPAYSWVLEYNLEAEIYDDYKLNLVATDGPYTERTNICQLLKNVITVEARAFEGTDGEAYIIPEGCRRIESRAFAALSGTRIKIFVPRSVKYIADDAFEDSDVIFVIWYSDYLWNYARDHGIDWLYIEEGGNG